MIKDILNANENITAGTTAVNKLKAVLPQCFDKDGNLYFDKLKELLRDEVSFADENYGLNFLGKSYARLVQAMEQILLLHPMKNIISSLKMLTVKIFILPAIILTL